MPSISGTPATRRKPTPTAPSPTPTSASRLDTLPPGRLLLLAEGEGRNAVYAARRGWQVTAVDFSDEGRAKALRLAIAQSVRLDYQVADLTALGWQRPGYYDAVGLIYAHLPPADRQAVHAAAAASLAPGGHLLLEAFGPGSWACLRVAPSQRSCSTSRPHWPATLPV
ncbi:class I SAM-dependent methyltransferase [Hymenobacter humi]|uniref:Class I SAM-dependent methyltransferase n=1 Tax=Hymenobacter humi TaxID=1411620 RepID=A0ABW2UCN1_9BACT